MREAVERARERFQSGIDLAPLARIAEAGASLRAVVSETMPGAPERLHVVSVHAAFRRP